MLKPLRTAGMLTGLALATAAGLPHTSAVAQAAPAVMADQAAAPTITAMLDQAANGAEVVVVVPSLSELSEAIAAFGTETGLDRIAPEFDDVLGTFKRQMGWFEGMDDEGPMLVVVTGMADAIKAELNDQFAQPDAVMLVPVTDYPGFVSQLGGDPAADVSLITLDGSEGYAKELNGYAVMGETLEQVQAYTAGDQGKALAEGLGPMVTDYLNGGDALIYVDVAALAPAINLAIDEAAKEITAEMNNPNNAMPAGMGGMVESMIKLYEDSARTTVDGTDKLLLSMDFGNDGLGMTIASQLTDGSELAGFFTPAAENKAASTSGGLLASLPDQPYIYASAIDAKQLGLTPLIQKIVAAMGEGDDAGLLAMYRDSIAVMKDIKGVASVFYAPEPAAMMAGGFYTSLTVYDVADADAFVTQQKNNFEKLAGMTFPLPAMEAGQPAQDLTFTSTYTEKALVIDGVEVDQFQVNVNLPPEMMQQFGPMAMLMGNAGTGGYIAAKDGKVIVSTVTDPQLITRGLQALGNDDGVGSAGAIATLRENDLPADASMELYISFAGIANTVNPFLLMFSPNGEQVAVPAELPPLAMGGASDGDAVALRMFIPHMLVKFAADTYEQFAPAAANNGPRDGAPRAPRAF